MSPSQLADRGADDSLEPDSFAFIVKIWMEETAGVAGSATWRGHITHVPSGERRYFERLDAIVDFIRVYLNRSGVEVTHRRKLWHWLKGLFRRR